MRWFINRVLNMLGTVAAVQFSMGNTLKALSYESGVTKFRNCFWLALLKGV
jgi:hypothetical protein